MRVDLLPTSFDGCVFRFIEESGEALKAIGKLQRFGEKATDPKTDICYDNVADLKSELVDLKHSISELEKFL